MIAFFFGLIFACLWLMIPFAARLLEKQNSLWWKCSWHKTEFWYSNRGDTQAFQPWHIQDKNVSHGICKACREDAMKGLWEP